MPRQQRATGHARPKQRPPRASRDLPARRARDARPGSIVTAHTRAGSGGGPVTANRRRRAALRTHASAAAGAAALNPRGLDLARRAEPARRAGPGEPEKGGLD